MQFDDVKTTVKDHPAETVAAVAVVGLVGTIVYCRWQKRKYERELARIEVAHAREIIEESRRIRSMHKLEFAQ